MTHEVNGLYYTTVVRWQLLAGYTGIAGLFASETGHHGASGCRVKFRSILRGDHLIVI